MYVRLGGGILGTPPADCLASDVDAESVSMTTKVHFLASRWLAARWSSFVV